MCEVEKILYFSSRTKEMDGKCNVVIPSARTLKAIESHVLFKLLEIHTLMWENEHNRPENRSII